MIRALAFVLLVSSLTITHVLSDTACGDITLNGQDDARYADCTSAVSVSVDPSGKGFAIHLDKLQTVSGDVAVQSIQIPSLSFPQLVSIGGRFQLMSATVDTISLPSLAQVGNAVWIQSSRFTSLTMPLQKAGNLFFYDGGVLPAVELPQLTLISGSLAIEAMDGLTLKLPKLSNVGGHMWIRDNGPVVLSLPNSLITIPEFRWEDTPSKNLTLPFLAVGYLSLGSRLESVDLNRLERVTGLFTVLETGLTQMAFPSLRALASAYFVNNRQLTSVSMPIMYGAGAPAGNASFTFMDNPNLVLIDAPSVMSIDGVLINNNPALDTVNFQALKTGVWAYTQRVNHMNTCDNIICRQTSCTCRGVSARRVHEKTAKPSAFIQL